LRGKCFDARARVDLAQRSVDEVRDATASLAQLASAESQSKPVDTRILLADAYLLNGLAERASGNANQANANFQQAWNAWPRNTADNPSSLAGKAINLAALGRKAEAASLAERLRRMNYKEPGFVRTLRSVQ
jgi:tetratricopeptide (TPR) repeat protein